MTWTLNDQEYEELMYKAEAYEWMADFMYDQVWDVHEVMCEESLYIAWLKKWEPDTWADYYGEMNGQEESIS